MSYDDSFHLEVKQAFEQSGAARSEAPVKTLTQWFYRAQRDGRLSLGMSRKLKRYLGFGTKSFSPHLSAMLREFGC